MVSELAVGSGELGRASSGRGWEGVLGLKGTSGKSGLAKSSSGTQDLCSPPAKIKFCLKSKAWVNSN